MHEFSIAYGIVRELECVASQHKARRIMSVTLQIGQLSGVDPEALRLAFPLAARGTIAECAKLRLKKTPAVLKCHKCGRSSRAAGQTFVAVCAHCAETDVQIIAGTELLILKAELETAEDKT